MCAGLFAAWTIADLAGEVGISRSALVERFSRYRSEPPMAYLTRWRLQLAAESLQKTSRGVADIATDIGFNRKPPSVARSDESLGSLQADTGANTSVRDNTQVRLDK